MMQWFQDKFVTPLCHYYTLESTIVYGLILVLAVWGTFKLLKKLGVKVDKTFLYALLPFIIYGGWTRALRDHLLGFYSGGWWWCTPFIYFIVFTITLGSLLLSLSIQKRFKISYHKPMIAIATILLLYNLIITRISNVLAVTIILSLMALWFAVFYGIHKIWPKKLSFENMGILLAHLLDGSSTFTALQFFGDFYREQHVLPNFLIDLSGPWVMFPLKIFVVLGVLYLIDKEMRPSDTRSFLKIVVLILGLAPGIRDFLTLAML